MYGSDPYPSGGSGSETSNNLFPRVIRTFKKTSRTSKQIRHQTVRKYYASTNTSDVDILYCNWALVLHIVGSRFGSWAKTVWKKTTSWFMKMFDGQSNFHSGKDCLLIWRSKLFQGLFMSTKALELSIINVISMVAVVTIFALSSFCQSNFITGKVAHLIIAKVTRYDWPMWVYL